MDVQENLTAMNDLSLLVYRPPATVCQFKVHRFRMGEKNMTAPSLCHLTAFYGWLLFFFILTAKNYCSQFISEI